ncbi:28S ribosomal protein S28, mitochondrial-like [Mizuhopecten yessoensis]|uniref:28S ribosomal protein S28, mitochondrial n=1 Tax=Mizuhopecten yessoensis TaxID=6573 RepID=A0A210QK79_MIZYE|nr:28S ribosomal protein S28, mitochondrial-like [Mizuhopecten yessoensis]OWF49152.1 28S ribosomal protein S28, mitochondrial [Mizuhopecten yessoensis]
MAALMKSSRALRNIVKYYSATSAKLYSSESDGTVSNVGFENTDYQNVRRSDAAGISLTSNEPTTGQKFASLLRKSKFVQIGDMRKTVVVGEIFEVVEDDMYIDFGCKFYCVCRKPRRLLQQDPRKFQRGSKVRILLQDYEMTASFSGTSKDVTLLESDATLLGSMAPENRMEDKVDIFRHRTESKERTNWEEKEPSFDIRTYISEINQS